MAMPFWVVVLIVHPLLVTLVAAVLPIWLLRRTGWWRRYKWPILGAAAVAYLIDSAFAAPRILYGWSLPHETTIVRKLPAPKALVIIHAGCRDECQRLLANGTIEEVIVVDRDYTNFDDPNAELPPVRYRAHWVTPGTCPSIHLRSRPSITSELAARGFCPSIEPATIPSDGVFIVAESFMVTANMTARRFVSRHLTTSPPGRVIDFFGQEVQLRSNGKIERVAARYVYTAPGLLGLPPLLGCWNRPDNILWIMPPGDTGCGFWRWFTTGGDKKWMRGDAAWIYADVLERPKPSPVNNPP